MDLGQGPSTQGLLFTSPVDIMYPLADEEVQQDYQPRRSGKTRVGLPLEKWSDVGMKGYIAQLKRVEELWWTPVLYDEACHDFNTFCTYAKLNPLSPVALRLHDRAMRKLETQQRLLGGRGRTTQAVQPGPIDELRKAFTAMKKLHTLLVRPTRHTNGALKPERLNILALSAVLAASGSVPKSALSTLKVHDVDLTALMLLAPPGPASVVADSTSDDWIIPPSVRDAAELRSLASPVFQQLTVLQFAFVRAEELEPRLELERDETGEDHDSQVRRISSVLGQCKQLKTLKLAFYRPEVQQDDSRARGSGHQLDMGGGGLGLLQVGNPDALSPVWHHGGHNEPNYSATFDTSLAPITNGASGAWDEPAPTELELSVILPACLPTLADDSRRFRFLREFVLSTIVLADSSALFNFISNHPLLEILGLEDVGIREGPTWSAVLAHVKKTLTRLRNITTFRLMHFEHNSGLLVFESHQLYQLVNKVMAPGVRVRYAI